MRTNAIHDPRTARLHSEVGRLFCDPNIMLYFGDGLVVGLTSACLKVSIENNESHGQGGTYELAHNTRLDAVNSTSGF
jgi:hypothetical protein